MICLMNHPDKIRCSLRFCAAVLFLCASVFGFADSTPAVEHGLPAGVTVSVDEATGRNRVTIQVGSDLLAVDYFNNYGYAVETACLLALDSYDRPF